MFEKSFTRIDNVKMSDADKSAQPFIVTFRHGGTRFTLPGFWSGGNKWKFRFAPTLMGKWTWRVSSPGRTFAEATTGTLHVTKGTNKGFVKKNPENPYTVCYSDGTPVFIWGNTGYDLLAQVLEGKTADWRAFIINSKADGMNKIRILVTMWNWGDLDGQRWYPWEDCSKADPHFTAFNISYWDALDSLVKYMQDKDELAELILFPDYNHRSNADAGLYGMTQEDEERYIRYVVARYAAYTNVIWCLANEWNLHKRARYGGRVPASWVTRLGGFLTDATGRGDPYVKQCGRLASVHQRTRIGFQFLSDKWPTYIQIQYGQSLEAVSRLYPKLLGHDWGNGSIHYNWNHNEPVFNDEYGYQNVMKGQEAKPRAKMRKAAWGIAMAGGYGSYGDATTPKDHPGYYGVWHDTEGQKDIKVMTGIIRSVDFVHMSPKDRLILNRPSGAYAYLLANPGHEYLMYAADGGYSGRYTLAVSNGKYDFKWIHTTSGNVYSGANGRGRKIASNEKITLTAPGFEKDTDAVLKISLAMNEKISRRKGRMY